MPSITRRSSNLRRVLASLVGVTVVTVAPPGCQVEHSSEPDPLGSPAGGDSSDGGSSTGDVAEPADAQRNADGKLVLPDPAIFGVDPDVANWDLPAGELEIVADQLADYDPRIASMRAEIAYRPAEVLERYVDIEVRLSLVSRDSEGAEHILDTIVLDTGDETVPDMSQGLVAAISADLDAATATCDAGELAGAGAEARGGALPGGGGWWARQLCSQQWNTYLVRAAAAEIFARMWVTRMEGSIPNCATLPEPDSIALCEAQLSDAIAAMRLVAIPSLGAATQYITLSRVMADTIKNLAALLQLGAPAGRVWWPGDAAATAVSAVSVAQAAIRMSARATGATVDAIAVLRMPQLVELLQEGAHLVLPCYWRSHDALLWVAHCMQNVANWVVIAGGAALVAGLLANARDRESTDALAADAAPFGLPPNFAILAGPWAPRANTYAALSPLVFDMQQLPSLHSALSLRQDQGKTYRTLDFGYLDIDAPLPVDAWGIDPWTELPTILAAAGTPVELRPDYGGPHDIGTIGIGDGKVLLQGALLDLSGQALDDQGQPVGLAWDCVSVYDACALTIETTGSPTEIEYGERTRSAWRLFTTASIVDPETGEPVEHYVGYVVELEGALERPSDPCFDAFDPVERRWLWNASAPGCGPHGMDQPPG